tara:strand:+ start:516 stop:815 length:300 start_codon:yes stop_codon:yes gene_type:complete
MKTTPNPKSEVVQQRLVRADPDLLCPWLPIETAPRDGTELLLWQRGVGCGVSWWGHDPDNEDLGWYKFNPTHWMPLPSPPNSQDISKPNQQNQVNEKTI